MCRGTGKKCGDGGAKQTAGHGNCKRIKNMVLSVKIHCTVRKNSERNSSI